MNKIIIILIVFIAGLWGYFQTILFPIKEYSCLFIFTSAIGGWLIGYLGSKYFLTDEY